MNKHHKKDTEVIIGQVTYIRRKKHDKLKTKQKTRTLKNQQMQRQHVERCCRGKNSTLHLYDLQRYQSSLQSPRFSTLDVNLSHTKDIRLFSDSHIL